MGDRATAGIVIRDATSGKGLEDARMLFREYASALGFDLSFQHFEDELKNLPGEYRPPLGDLLVGYSGRFPAGCVALRPLGEKVCEMKRLYVRPAFRGQGFGRGLAESIVRRATSAGYLKMMLDTVPAMREARALYESMGFKTREPYRFNPLPGAIYMELILNKYAVSRR